MATVRKYIWSLIIFAALMPIPGNAQQGQGTTAAWRPMSFSSALKLGGHYRYQEGISNNIYNIQENPQFYAGVAFTSNSYFWHPNFMVLDFGAEYNPIKNQDKYLVIPDQSEVNTIKKLDASATFFKQKPINLRVFANINECYTNRENLSNLKLNSFNWGGVLNFSNKIVPVQVSYRDGSWKEEEINSGRVYNMRQKNLQAEANKSFTSLDRNELRLSHNNYFRQDDNFPPISNISDNFDLINQIDFDKKNNYAFHSNISGINQKGNDEFSRIQANESLTLKLPQNFTLSGNYDYYYNQRVSQKSKQHNIYGSLGYKLFESLTANVYFEDNSLKHTLYQESNKKIGMGIRYIKKIPTGHFALSYESFKQRQKRVSDVTVLEVFNEDHLLSDGLIVLLDKSFIYVGSVVVKDATGTII